MTDVSATCWCGGEVGPREPGDEHGLGCLENVMHDYSTKHEGTR